MVNWREPEPPPVEKMPRPRGPKKPSYGGRVIAGVAGIFWLGSVLWARAILSVDI